MSWKKKYKKSWKKGAANKMRFKKILLLSLFFIFLSMPAFALANTDGLEIETQNILLDIDGDSVQVMDMIALRNISGVDILSDKDNQIIKFNFPVDIEGVELSTQDGAEIDFELIGQDLVLYTDLPANRGLDFSIKYHYHYPGDSFNLAYNSYYPIKKLSYYSAVASGISITSQQIIDSGMMYGNENRPIYNYYGLLPIAANQNINLKLTINPVANENTDPNNRTTQGYDGFHNPGHIRFWENSPLSKFNPHLMTFVFVVIVIFGIVYYFYRWRIQENNRQDDSDDDVFLRLYKEENILMKKIAETQVKFNDGEMSEEEYQKRYDVYMKKLVNIKKKIKGFTE